MTPSEQEVFDALNRMEQKHGHMVVPLDFTALPAVIGALQLALRHPEFAPRPSAQIVRRAIRNIQDGLKEEPVLVALIEMGFNPHYDR
ncbi:MAG: hypothetical protein MOB07_24280 [Acidobacteria bacterium]|nr:hypothetical protein [Acidobacteriota bacterium]